MNETTSALTPYRVYLKQAGSDAEEVFEAHAEDIPHAVKQARNAYPGCKVIWLGAHGSTWVLTQWQAEYVDMDDDGEWGFMIRFTPSEDGNHTYRAEEWRCGDIVDTHDAPSYTKAREWIIREHPGHCAIRYSLAALCDLWNELSDIPVTDDGHLEKGFLFFPVGADREDVWHWFESVNPAFLAGEAGSFIGENHPYKLTTDPDPKRSAFIAESVSDTPPVPCEFQKGDVVTVLNGMGVEIPGKRIVGFVREIDPNWRPESFVYLDWDCYWFPVSTDRLTLESRAEKPQGAIDIEMKSV